MNVWKKILIGIIILLLIFGAGFLTGFLVTRAANKTGDLDNQNRIAELKQLNKELELGYTELERNYKGSEERLTEFLKRESDRYDKALQILEGSGGKASEAEGSIGRALSAVDRLSTAINILLEREQIP